MITHGAAFVLGMVFAFALVFVVHVIECDDSR